MSSCCSPLRDEDRSAAGVARCERLRGTRLLSCLACATVGSRSPRRGDAAKLAAADGLVAAVALALTAIFLAEVVEPWPEGPTLLPLHRLDPHGVSMSDVVVLGALGVFGFGWLRLIAARGRRPRPSRAVKASPEPADPRGTAAATTGSPGRHDDLPRPGC